MPEVIRIEHPETKKGPYAEPHEWGIALACMVERHNTDYDKHPNPLEDKGIKRGMEKDKELCGFSDLWQLYRWFSKDEIIMLDSFGYEITVIEDATITAAGKKQILFTRGVQNDTV